MGITDVVSRLTLIALLDILLFSVAVYGLLALGLRHGSRRGLIVLTLLGGIYLLALRWQMPLSLAVFRFGFSAVIVALVIAYQDDVRAVADQLFQRLFAPDSEIQPRTPLIADIIVRAAFQLAEKKRGALIVVRGDDPLDRHLDGGVALDAVVSVPLLCSLFDPSSPGHDGAVVIDSGRATRFAVHLPLARSGRAGEHGTRHHAALGLADSSDAIVLVASEERGVVSVARDGQLNVVTNPGDLKRQLQERFSRYDKRNRESIVRAALSHHLLPKAAAVAISFACWWLVAQSSSDVSRTFLVPVQYENVPPDVPLSQTLTREVRVTLSGSENAFRFLAPSVLVVSIDVRAISTGKRLFNVTEESVRHPANLRVSAIEPRAVYVSIATPGRPQPK